MEREHTPAEVRPNRTVYRLSECETIQALMEFVERRGEEMPRGKWAVWLADRHRPGQKSWCTTLVVDHRNPLPADLIVEPSVGDPGDHVPVDPHRHDSHPIIEPKGGDDGPV